MTCEQIVDTVKERGFANAGPLALSSADATEFSTLADQIFRQMPPDHPHYLGSKTGGEGFRGVPEHSPRLAELLNRIVSTPAVGDVLRSLLGTSYKLWQIDFRRSSPGDPGLYLHQDAPGQLNIALLLSDNPTGAGATIFFPGSHRFVRRMKETGVTIPPSLIRLAEFCFTPVSGQAGDLAFFLNRTWHGRFENRTNQSFDIILIGFYPAGGRMGFPKPYVTWSPELLASLAGTELGRLMDPSIDTALQPDGLYQILPRAGESDVSFALGLERAIQTRPMSASQQFTITSLRLAMAAGGLASRGLRVLGLRRAAQ